MNKPNTYNFIPLNHAKLSEEEMLKRSKEHFEHQNQRRSVREFSDQPIPIDVLKNIIKTASTAPSGANNQPWTFALVSDPAIKKEIRIAAEKEEKESYSNRMSERWLRDLEPLGTTWEKPFLEIAPYLIVVFKRVHETVNGEKLNNYYVNESVGLAAGMLISAIHNAGLVTLTHTPSPMNFLQKVLNRPENERAFLLLPVGYPEDNCTIPDINRKALEQVMVEY